MAQSRQYVYSGVDKPTLPYVSWTSPINTSPHFVSGSQNLLSTAIGYLEKRPGFSVRLFETPFAGGVINRLQTWETWDGTFFLIASATDGTNAYVLSANITGGQTLFHTVFTLPNSTQPFDFVISRNLVFFGNGQVGSMNKWDGAIVTKWGVDAPTQPPTFSFQTPVQATATSSISGGAVSGVTITNPGTGYNPGDPPLVTFTGGGGANAIGSANVGLGAVSGVALNTAGSGLAVGFSNSIPIPGGGGNGLTINYRVTGAGGSHIGTVSSLSIANAGSGYPGNFSFSFGNGPGAFTQATATATVSEPYGTIASISIVAGGTGYTSAPAVTIGAPGISAFTGYQWGYTYTTRYGHESNMSPLSNKSGLFTSLMVLVAVSASTDRQVNGINIYRTTDGGSNAPNEMQMVGSFTNQPSSFTDQVNDIDLQLQSGPALLANTPPTPCYGFVYWNNRIIGLQNGTTYYSGAEEISNGVPEEAWPSGLDGNFQPWPQKVMGLGQTPDLLAIGLASQFWQTTGDSLDTFRISPLLDKRGVRGVTAIASVGNEVIWFDRSHQLWLSSAGEIGQSIRTDLANVDPAKAYVGMHVQDTFHWIYLLDPVNGMLYTYDLDLQQWNAPWTVPGAIAITSGELSAGNTMLYLAFSDGHICSLQAGTFNDNGVQYKDSIVTNLFNTVPGGDSTARNRDLVAQVEQFEIEMAGFQPDYVAQANNDDPGDPTTAWFDLTTAIQPPSFQDQGFNIIRWVFRSSMITGGASRAAFRAEWFPAENAWKVYSFDVAFRGVAG